MTSRISCRDSLVSIQLTSFQSSLRRDIQSLCDQRVNPYISVETIFFNIRQRDGVKKDPDLQEGLSDFFKVGRKLEVYLIAEEVRRKGPERRDESLGLTFERKTYRYRKIFKENDWNWNEREGNMGKNNCREKKRRSGTQRTLCSVRQNKDEGCGYSGRMGLRRVWITSLVWYIQVYAVRLTRLTES